MKNEQITEPYQVRQCFSDLFICRSKIKIEIKFTADKLSEEKKSTKKNL